MSPCMPPSDPSGHNVSWLSSVCVTDPGMSVSLWYITSPWPLPLSGPLRHKDSLCLTHYVWSIMSWCLRVCLFLIYYVIMSPCLSPSDILRQSVSLLVYYVIIYPCLSPAAILRHNVSLSVYLCDILGHNIALLFLSAFLTQKWLTMWIPQGKWRHVQKPRLKCRLHVHAGRQRVSWYQGDADSDGKCLMSWGRASEQQMHRQGSSHLLQVSGLQQCLQQCLCWSVVPLPAYKFQAQFHW